MMNIRKADIVWSYLAQFFSIGANLLVLPVILSTLSPEEIGFNYVLMSITGFVVLFDLGFAPQIGRNITYVYGGAQHLKKEGMDLNTNNSSINYRLLATIIQAAKFLYRRLSVMVLLLLLFGGTFYVYEITDEFTLIKNSLSIWIVYICSVFFNMYYAYYSALLNGKGLIAEHRKALVCSKLTYLVVCFLLLYLNVGLLSIAIANLLSAFITRFMSNYYFFTRNLKSEIDSFKSIPVHEIRETIRTIWHNAKKLGLVYLGSFTVGQIGLIMSGLYLPLADVGSFGLLIQIVALITVLSATVNTSYQARIAFLKTRGEVAAVIQEFSYTLIIFVAVYFILSAGLIVMGNWVLDLIGSNTELPANWIILIYCAVIFFEKNYNIFTSYILLNNTIPFVKSVLLSGFAISLVSYLVLRYTDLGILGLILVPFVIQSFYNNWKWPLLVCKEFNTNYLQLLAIGYRSLLSKINFSRI